MNVSPTIVLLSSLVLGLSLVACAPPTPKADPPRTLKPVEYGTLSVANIGTRVVQRTLPERGRLLRSLSE